MIRKRAEQVAAAGAAVQTAVVEADGTAADGKAASAGRTTAAGRAVAASAVAAIRADSAAGAETVASEAAAWAPYRNAENTASCSAGRMC